MQLRAFLFLSFLSFAFSTTAQNFKGVWQGSFLMNGKKKQKINIMIEIAQKDGLLIGVVTTRGIDKSIIYGCDYVVAGNVKNNKLILVRRKVQRTVAIEYDDCVLLRRIELFFDRKDTMNTVKGKWVWDAENVEEFTAQRTATEISESAKEEVSKGIKGGGDADAKKQEEVRTKIELRHKKVDELVVENGDITIIVSMLEKVPNTSVNVLLNGKLVIDEFNLSMNMMDVRFKVLDLNKYYINIINTSDHNRRLPVKIVLQQGSFTKEWTTSIEPDGNAWLLLKRKEE